MGCRLAAAAVAGGLVLAAGGVAFLPWTANHFGYALPTEHGLPYRIHHAGRDYRGPACAGAGWCAGSPYCVPFGGDETALTQVDEVGTWFGPSHAVYTAESVTDGVPIRLLVRADGNCFVGYALMGGP
ncbi:hypothetical protein [Amycolatopsis kentuckyensis]|uniref:hypothetical protein n=1 Tax=Amycolatopsis kentuckyensis TaxID=218823 RepID=UPI00356A78C6